MLIQFHAKVVWKPKIMRFPVGGSLKIKVNAAPIEGKANKRLIEFLAKEFGVSRSAVVLESGHTSKSKRLRIKAPAKMPTDVALNQTLF